MVALRLASLFLAGCIGLCGQTPTYVGARICGQCHPAEFRKQSATGHSRALFRATEHPLAKVFLPKTPLRRNPDFEFRYALDKRGILVRVSSPAGAVVLPLEWAFGAGDQAVTFVSRLGPSSYLEHYFTYYSSDKKMSVTPGQEALTALGPMDAAGFVHKDLDAAECFQCHSTGPVDISGGDFQPHETGVQCEACHGPGSAHQSAKGKGAIRNPRYLPPVELNDACGRCHRLPPSAGAKSDWENPWNVRFQPVYLSQSACFQNSGGRLTCLSCHAAHENVRRSDPAYYNAVCSSCHSRPHREEETKMDCIGCHMPRVSPRPALRFTNHWIGAYGSGNLKPGNLKTNLAAGN